MDASSNARMLALADDSKSLRMPSYGELQFLWAELTPRCNLTCAHCYADSGPSKPLSRYMQLNDWLTVLDQAADLGCRGVQFVGGEPTLYPGLAELIGHARFRRFHTVEVFTNGTAFTAKLKETFKRHQVSLAFSCYAAAEDIHDRVTGLNGSFAKTLASIQWAIEAGVAVRVVIVAMQANAGHIEETKQFLKRLGVTSVRVDRIRGIGRGRRETGGRALLSELCGRCGHGRLCISYDGLAYPCIFSRSLPVGNVQAGLALIVRGKRLGDVRAEIEVAKNASRPRLVQNIPCGPDAPEPPCGPQAPEPPCGPDTPQPPCGPDAPEPPCGPDAPEPPCGPDTPEPPCGPEAPEPPCGPQAPEPP